MFILAALQQACQALRLVYLDMDVLQYSLGSITAPLYEALESLKVACRVFISKGRGTAGVCQQSCMQEFISCARIAAVQVIIDMQDLWGLQRGVPKALGGCTKST